MKTYTEQYGIKVIHYSRARRVMHYRHIIAHALVSYRSVKDQIDKAIAEGPKAGFAKWLCPIRVQIDTVDGSVLNYPDLKPNWRYSGKQFYLEITYDFLFDRLISVVAPWETSGGCEVRYRKIMMQ